MSNMVDMFPILQKFPSALQVRGTKLNQDIRETYGGYIRDVEQNLKNGIPVNDCLAKSMIQSRSKEHLTELDTDMLAAAFMIGGIETVRNLPPMALDSPDNFYLRRQQLSYSGFAR